jgi:hypothetical protein
MLLRTPLVWGSVGLIWWDFHLVLPTKKLISSCLWVGCVFPLWWCSWFWVLVCCVLLLVRVLSLPYLRFGVLPCVFVRKLHCFLSNLGGGLGVFCLGLCPMWRLLGSLLFWCVLVLLLIFCRLLVFCLLTFSICFLPSLWSVVCY